MPHYTVKRRLVSVGRDYKVTNESDELVFKVDGRVRFARTFAIKDAAGARVLAVREKLLCLDPTYIIKRAADTVATVKRTSPSGDYPMKFAIEIVGKGGMKAEGRLFRGGRVELSRDGFTAGSVSRQMNTVVHEIFHVAAASSEDQALMLAIVMSIVEIAPSRGA